jgi:hypothetical protein
MTEIMATQKHGKNQHPLALLSHKLPFPQGAPKGHKRAGVRGSNQGNCLISYSLILSFSLREKGRSVLSAAIDFHVGSSPTVCMNLYIPAPDA